jgi:SET domain-containing protein
MSVGWYLNHSQRPNLSVSDYRALSDIAGGSELTINYRHFEEP